MSHKYCRMCDEGADRLVEAIVAQAAMDYKHAYTEFGRHPRLALRRQMQQTEKFFRSNWFHTLTGLDGNAIMSKLGAR